MTKLGIKTNIMAMLVCIVGFVSGYVGALLIAGYILLMEGDRMLRKTAIKALTIMCVSSLLVGVIELIPGTVSWIASVLQLFDGSMNVGILLSICDVLSGAVRLAEAFILLIMAFKAYKGSEFSVKQLDNIVANAEGTAVKKSEGVTAGDSTEEA